MKSKSAFSAVEVLLVIAIVAAVASFSMPMYRNYQIVNELDVTTDAVVQALHRARNRSQVGEEDNGWGYSVGSGVLYKGEAFSSRDPGSDESYAIPPSIDVTGLLDVSFARLTGVPSATGTILLTAINGAQRTILIDDDPTVIIPDPEEKLTICHKKNNTLYIPEAAWPAHQAHGDIIGACAQ